MLQQFFASFIIVGIFSTAFVVIKMTFLLYDFLIRAISITKLYEEYKENQKKGDFTRKDELECWKYQVKVTDTNEACNEFEKMIDEALKYYDKLGVLANGNDIVNIKKDKLIDICNEVRMIRWRSQGI